MSTRFIAHCVYPDSRQESGVEDPPFFFQFHLLTLWLFGYSDSLCTVILLGAWGSVVVKALRY
jgi:hypothetical protein